MHVGYTPEVFESLLLIGFPYFLKYYPFNMFSDLLPFLISQQGFTISPHG